MLRNYLKVALRNLSKQKGLSLINILGLSIGLACFSLFLLYAINELTYDRWHEHADRIYRVYRWTEALDGRAANGDAHLPMPLGPAMQERLPDVEAYVRFRTPWNQEFVRAGGSVHREGITFADPSVFKVFSFPLLYGRADDALAGFQSIVLTRSTALRLFGEENPTGKTLEIKLDNEYVPFTVTAVAEDIPANSTLTFDVLANFSYLASATQLGERYRGHWKRSAFMTFVLLKPGSGLAQAEERLLSFRREYYPDEEATLRESGTWQGEGPPVNFRLQPITAMHTDPQVRGGFVAPVSPGHIWIMLAIAAAVLLIACINFTTLAIGRSAGRAREIGVRKVVGGSRLQLAGQFLTESILLAVLSAGAGLGLGYLLLPAFNGLADRELAFSWQQYPELSWLFVGLTLMVGLLAGLYPSLVMSGFRPVEVLKSKIRLKGSNLFTRSLVTFQFLISMALIAATLIILQQVDLLRNRHPGFNKENIVVVNADGTDSKKIWPLFREALLREPNIVGISSTEASLGANQGYSNSSFLYHEEAKRVFEYFVDPDYLDVMGVKLLAGRNFDPAIASDTLTSIIINETMMQDFGWTLETAIGQPLTGFTQDAEQTPIVIGVVEDFNYMSMHDVIMPQMLHQFRNYSPMRFLVRIPPGDPSQALVTIDGVWSSLVSEPLSYSFMDEDLAQFYESEERWGAIVAWAGGIAIFLACLGLLGLAALAVANRTKEIGIRKVLGATLTAIVGLLSKDFIRLVVIAFVLAVPLAWYPMQRWLQDFAYRIDMPWWVFAIAGMAGVGIAFLTVAIQGLRAAMTNPVDSLRSE